MGSELELGRLDLVSKISDLQLRLTSSATVAPSAEDDIAQIQDKLTECRLSPSSNDRPWFTRGSPFILILKLRIETGLKPEDQDAVVEALSTQLRIAKVPIHALCILLQLSDTKT